MREVGAGLLEGEEDAADGRAEPQLAAPAIAEAARDKGAVILTECAVRGVETSGSAISGVVTERGPIACAAVVLAGGAWSRLFSGNLGIEFPQLKVMNTVRMIMNILKVVMKISNMQLYLLLL